jgi:phage-related protein
MYLHSKERLDTSKFKYIFNIFFIDRGGIYRLEYIFLVMRKMFVLHTYTRPKGQTKSN